MKSIIILIFIGGFFLGCKTESTISDENFEFDCLEVPENKDSSYFPENAFDDSAAYEGRGDFLNSWYSKHLFSMEEPIIFKCSENVECYRFTWLRTFHEPVAIRLTRKNADIVLNWKQTNGQGGYDAGEVIRSGSKNISENEFKVFKNKLKSCKFFDSETVELSMGHDGARWILEGVNLENDYHLVDRWDASKTSYGKVCLYLLSLTKLKVKKDLIY